MIPHELAVVPVVVNAGAALFPALIAGAASVISLLFRPRALVAAARRRPALALTFTAAVAGITTAGYYITQLAPAKAGPVADLGFWPALARQIQADQKPHKVFAPLWSHPLDNEMAFATPALFTPPKDSKDRAILYQPSGSFTPDSQTGAIWALDALTGKKLWKTTTYQTPGGKPEPLRPVFSSPAVTADGSRLLSGQGLHEDANCALVCFDTAASLAAQTGKAFWAVGTPLHLESSPSLFTMNGSLRVVIGAGAIEGPNNRPIGNPGYVFCVDVATGKELWQQPIRDPEDQPIIDPADNTIYIGACLGGNEVVALRPGTPEELKGQPRVIWRTPTPFAASGESVLAHDAKLGDILLLGGGNGDYVSSNDNPVGLVLVFNRTNGRLIWQTRLPDSVLGRVALADGNKILAPSRDGRLYALDLQTGKQLWRADISETKVNNHPIPILAGVVIDGPYAFAIAADGTLAAVNTQNGAIVDRIKLADETKPMQNYTIASPRLVDHVLYVPTETLGLQVFKINQ